MKSHIADLEEQVEYWRQRSEAAEMLLHGRDWGTAIPPLTLYQTRVMRLLARRPYSPDALTFAMQMEYDDTSKRCLYIAIFHIRNKLPANIAPSLARRNCAPYDVPDRDALKAFLNLNMQERQAA